MRWCLLGSLTMAVAAAESGAGLVSAEFIFEQAPYPEAHASTIEQTTAGTVLAAWFGGTQEQNPDVGIWLSRLEDGRWTEAVEVVNGIQYTLSDGTVVRHATWNPVLFQSREGPLLLFYKVGPSPQAWWGMLTTSEDDGRTWSEPRRLPEGILGPIKNRPVQLPDGTLVSPSSHEEKHTGGWTVHFERTLDLGRTWTRTPPMGASEGLNSIQPSLLVHRDGRLQALCRSMEKVITQTWSADGGLTWSPLASTGVHIPNSGSDATTLADGRFLLVYNHQDATDTNHENWGVRYPLNIAVSDDGITWKMVAVLETEPCKYGYSYPSVIQAKDGLVHVTYTWDRKHIKHVVLDPAALR